MNRPILQRTTFFTVCFVAIVCLSLVPAKGVAGPLPAGSVEFSASGTNVSATVLFAPINGGIEITLTNTESGTIAKGQAISALHFSVVAPLNAPTAFYKLTGKNAYANNTSAPFGASLITPGQALPSGQSFTSTSTATVLPSSIDHWGFNTSGSAVTLVTAGSPVPGAGNPHWMILPSSGTAGGASSLIGQHGQFDPFIIGPGSFFLTVPGIKSNSNLFDAKGNPFISSVSVGFGTGPDTTSGGKLSGEGPPNITPKVGVVPAPPSAVMFGLGGLILAGGLMVRSRRQLVAA